MKDDMPMEQMKKEYKDEIRLGYKVTATMQKVWDVELDLAEKLIDVCKRNNLRVYMDFGTLLGAVRHKGFIPWDDDMDFAMPRKDYDKLLDIAEKEFTGKYFLQSYRTSKYHLAGNACLKNVETTQFRKGEEFKDGCYGICIDVFVLDGFIPNPVVRFLNRCAVKGVKHLMRKFSCQKGFALHEWFLRLCSLKNKTWGRLAYRYSRRGNLTPSASYDKTVMLDFEGHQMPAPKGWHEVLVGLFGEDYMTPKIIVPRGGWKYFNTEKSYKEMTPVLREHPEMFDIPD